MIQPTTVQDGNTRTFHMKVLGRMLEHLGVQMYKHRDAALAELVANAWDAGAKTVWISVPDVDMYDPSQSEVTIRDNGSGMSPDDLEDHYLVVGRNRRSAREVETHGRPVMGRKGIGKLAAFGLASSMNIRTWNGSEVTTLDLDMADLKKSPGDFAKVELVGAVVPQVKDVSLTSDSGTVVTLRRLKHKTPMDAQGLRHALGRRLSRRVRGRMRIFVNDELVEDPPIAFDFTKPAEDGSIEDTLSDGQIVTYRYGFSNRTIKDRQMRGWAIYVRGKTAQAPPYFFEVEGTASGQHGTRYLSGEIHADFLDAGEDDESDRVSTDRQELDWEDASLAPLKAWGAKLTRRLLKEWAERKGDEFEDWLLEDADFAPRIEALDPSSHRQLSGFLKQLGRVESDRGSVRPLADSLVKAFEYKNFHDVIGDLQNVGDDPDALAQLLGKLREWKVLESRTILEIVNGRLQIIEKFRAMVVTDAPETAHRQGDDNLHDLIARYPWLLNPEWQVLAEEKTISRQLKEWDAAVEVQDGDNIRYDFIALQGDGKLVIVEIKRGNHGPDMSELNRLETYKDRLSTGTTDRILMLMVSGRDPVINKDSLKAWQLRDDADVVTWSHVVDRARRHYEHYRAVLEGDVASPEFAKKQREVQGTRSVLATGSSYRTRKERSEGLGPQDIGPAAE